MQNSQLQKDKYRVHATIVLMSPLHACATQINRMLARWHRHSNKRYLFEFAFSHFRCKSKNKRNLLHALAADVYFPLHRGTFKMAAIA